MTKLVVDASIGVGWMLEDEEGELLDHALATVQREGAVVPVHWHFEIRNALVMSLRRKRLSELGLSQRLAWLQQMDIESDHEVDLDSALSLAIEHGLTFYDALYLELALRQRLLLATLDQNLRRAARSTGAELQIS